MKTMYETNWHYKNVGPYEVFDSITMNQISVIREHIPPGCSEVFIDAIDENGIKFTGKKEYYFETEELAKENIKKWIDDRIENASLETERSEQQKLAYMKFRKTL